MSNIRCIKTKIKTSVDFNLLRLAIDAAAESAKGKVQQTMNSKEICAWQVRPETYVYRGLMINANNRQGVPNPGLTFATDSDDEHRPGIPEWMTGVQGDVIQKYLALWMMQQVAQAQVGYQIGPAQMVGQKLLVPLNVG